MQTYSLLLKASPHSKCAENLEKKKTLTYIAIFEKKCIKSWS